MEGTSSLGYKPSTTRETAMSPKDATFFLSEGGFVDLEDDVGKISSRCRTTYLCKRKTKIKAAETP